MGDFLVRAKTGAVLAILFLTFFLVLPPTLTALGLVAILLIILVSEWPKFLDIKKPLSWLTSLLYPILPFSLLIYMSSIEHYRYLIFYMIILASSNDCGGYFFGNLLGKHKIAPKISPKKTWEGFFGGWFLTLLATIIILLINKAHISLPIVIPFSLAVATLASAGDFFESYLKRRAGIKDSGTLLPGHGGFLDRFDGYLFLVLFFFVLRDYLITFFNVR